MKVFGTVKNNVAAALAAVALCGVMAFSNAVPAYAAAQQQGSGGAVYAGADVNTFAAGLDLAEIWIDASKFRSGKINPVLNNNEYLTTVGSNNVTVQLKSGILSPRSSNDFSGKNISWYYDYPDAAELPDGTKAKVRLTGRLKKVETSGTGNNLLIGKITLDDGNGISDGGHRMTAGVIEGSYGPWAYKAYIDYKIEVFVSSPDAPAAGSFLVSFNGFNQRQNLNTQSWTALQNRGEDFVREHLSVPDGNVIYPTSMNSEISSDNGRVRLSAGNNSAPGKLGDDKKYNSGLVTTGSSGFAAEIGIIGAISSGGAPQGNNVFISFGDLQHRITSGSGGHGKIKTGKSGSGTDLEGGSFSGNASSVSGSESTLRRYVVPDAKVDVTYTMTPDQGYKIGALLIDGSPVADVSKMKKEESRQVSYSNGSSNGDGTLKYDADGKYTFTFNSPNAADHSIYVEWTETTADIRVGKEWSDDGDAEGLRHAAMTASNKPKIRLQRSVNGGATWEAVPGAAENVPDGKDGDVYSDGIYYINNNTGGGHDYTWEELPVFTYDSNGDIARAILYRLEETPAITGYDTTYDYGDNFDLTDNNTTDNAAAVKTVVVKNEYVPKPIYVEVIKNWDDAAIKSLQPDPADPSVEYEYERRDVTFTLSGTTPSGPVDLNGDEEGENLSLTLSNTDPSKKFEDLKMLWNAEPITYSVDEVIPDGFRLKSRTELVPVYHETTGKIEGYTVSFTNEPVTEEEYEKVIFSITKKDKETEEALAGAEFTVYKNAECTEKAVENTGTETGEVSQNTVLTDGNGGTFFEFNKSGTYYIKETKAPLGYEADASTYVFTVDSKLKSVKLKAIDQPQKSWWNILYELIFVSASYENWNSENKILTVYDEPLRGSILVNKVWDDNNDQDGARPTDVANMPKVTLQYTTADTPPQDDSGWIDVTIKDGENTAKAEAQVSHEGGPVTSEGSVYTWEKLPAFRGGKLVTYRIKETGQILSDGIYSASYDHDSFNLATVSADGKTASEKNQVVRVTNTHEPQKITINAKKIWDDDGNVENIRPAELDVSLYQIVDNRETRIAELTLDGYTDEGDENYREKASGTTYHENDTWNAVFSDLPAYHNGTPVRYRLAESVPNKYTPEYSASYIEKGTDNTVTKKADYVDSNEIKRTFNNGKETTSATITVENIQLLDIKVSKRWIKGANANVVFQLYRKAGSSTNPAQVQWSTIECEAEPKYVNKNNESDTITTSKFNELNEGEREEYTRREVSHIVIDDSWTKVDGASHTFVPGSFVYTEAAPGDAESYVFENMPKYDPDGNLYTYVVKETSASGSDFDDRYEADYSIDGLSVTNTNLKASDGTANLGVIKVLEGRNWNDSDEFYFHIEPIKGIDDDGRPLDFKESESADKANVPLPNNGVEPTQTGIARSSNTATSKQGRIVSFAPITIEKNSFAENEPQKTFYYKIYEVKPEGDFTKIVSEKDDKGISYAAQDPDASEWEPKISVVRVVASKDANGDISTSISWDPEKASDGHLVWKSDTPSFVNTYYADAKIKAHIVKHIAGREFEDGDSFKFNFANLPGSIVRTELSDDGYVDSRSGTTAVINYNTKRKVEPDGHSGNFKPTDADGTGGVYRASDTDIKGFYKISDLSHVTADGRATDTFVYELRENSYSKEHDSSDSANGKDLLLDEKVIYIKVIVTDNQDGTLDVQKSYWYDAACSEEPVEANVLVYKNDVSNHEAGDIAPPGASENDVDSNSEKIYEYVPAAIFENTRTIDIPVVKEWIGGPAVEDVTLRLQRHLFKLSDESSLTAEGGDDFVRTAQLAWEADSSNTEDFWLNVGSVYNVGRGEFLNDDGSPRYDDPSTKTSRARIENKAHFNRDLPVYVTENGEKYRAVYRLIEDDTSDAYKTSYRSVQAGNITKDGDNIFIDSGEMYVTNTVTASNTANIAAVKQLQGRQWLDNDDFAFKLTPAGKAVYDDQDRIVSINSNEPIPLPDNDSERKSQTTSDGLSSFAVTHAVNGNQMVDPNGGLERLARFGEIPFELSDLEYDHTDRHMQGDFFYKLTEKLPQITTEGEDQSYPVEYTYRYTEGSGSSAETKTKTEKISDKQFPTPEEGRTLVSIKWNDGMTYDCTEHTVHIKVRENRTDKLQVQIAYDESERGNIETGTQFTPVFTNSYEAEAAVEVSLSKYIMGRQWKDGDNFDFVMIPMAGAPFEDYDTDEFYKGAHSLDDAEREDGLEKGKAIHNKEGQHVKRLVIPVDKIGSTEPATMSFPKLMIRSSDLHRTVSGSEQGDDVIKYKNGTVAPAGTKYGRFMYAIEETSEFDSLNEERPDDLIEDRGTEYARVTVIDKNDGTLEYYVEMFEDRYASNPRHVPDPDGRPSEIKATSAIFANQLKRELTVTKAWAGMATGKAILRLQWSIDKTHWYDVETTRWFRGVDGIKTISKDDLNNLQASVKWTGLPAYANISRERFDDTDGTSGNDKDLDDCWIYYQVKEDPIELVETRYSSEAYNSGDSITDSKYSVDPVHTEEEKNSGEYISDRIEDLYVTNFPENISAEARIGVVKQFVGKTWEDEEFDFEIEPVSSKYGRKEDMPAFSNNIATATTRTAEIGVNERAADFEPLVIRRSDLTMDSSTGIKRGEFVYKIKERIPDGAIKVQEGDKTFWYSEDSEGRWIKYTAEEHNVKVVASDDGSGDINISISYDDRLENQFVPVYTNYAMMKAPISGKKAWIGGSDSEHVNGSVTLDDNGNITAASDGLGLKLQRRLDGETEASDVNLSDGIQYDDAGRRLAVVWVEENRNHVPVSYVHKETGEEIGTEDYDYLSDEEKSYYKEVTEVRITREDKASGNGVYTVKAIDSEGNYTDPILRSVDDNDAHYRYSIVEGSVPANYEVSYDCMDITNTDVLTDSLKVTKTWSDKNDAEGLRPDNSMVTMHLFKVVESKTGEGAGAVTNRSLVQVEQPEKEITKSGAASEEGGSAEWTGLPVYGPDGEKIKYVVLEETVAGYKTEYKVPGDRPQYVTESDGIAAGYSDLFVELDGDKASSQTVDVKNSLTPETDIVNVTKDWEDGNNIDGKRPADVTIELYEYVWNKTSNQYEKSSRPVAEIKLDGAAESEASENQATGIKTQETTAQGSLHTWTGSFTHLPAKKNDRTVIYAVKEHTEHEHYAEPGTAGKYSNKPIITGSQIEGFTVTNNYTPETTSASITKVWEDHGNEFRMRPDYIELSLMKKASDGSLVSAKDAEGNDITLKLSEEDARDYVLFKSSRVWTETLKGLPKYERIESATPGVYESREITYYWQETVPGGYTATGSGNSNNEVIPSSGISTGTPVEGNGSNTIAVPDNGTITNTMVTGSLSVTKTWVDKNNSENFRPDAAHFARFLMLKANGTELTRTNNQGITEPWRPEVTDNGNGEYTAVWTGIPTHSKGNPISYSVFEEDISANDDGVTVGGIYTPSINPSQLELSRDETTGEWTGSVSIINTHVPDRVTIYGTKVWIDGNKEHVNENEVTLTLHRKTAGGDPETVTTDAEGNNLVVIWSGDAYTFVTKNGDEYNTYCLPEKDRQGKAYEYWVTETLVAGYQAPVYMDGEGRAADKGAPAGGFITNRIQQDHVRIGFTKIWDDADNYANIRPDSVTFHLYRNTSSDTSAELIDSIKVDGMGNAENNRKTVQFPADESDAGYDKYAGDGSEYNYFVREEPDSRYTAHYYKTQEDYNNKRDSYTGVPSDGIIVNHYDPDEITLHGTKVWDDGGKSHNNSEELKSSGGSVADIKLQRTTSRNINSDGVEWENYTGDFNIEWNNDGKFDDGNYTQSFTIGELPYKEGSGSEEKIYHHYRLVEDGLQDGYTASYSNASGMPDDPYMYDGGTITNTKHNKISIYAKKVWTGDSADTGKRQAVSFQLYRISGDTETKIDDPKLATEHAAPFDTIGEADGYVVWSDQPLIVEGKEVRYEVREVKAPEDYTSETKYCVKDGSGEPGSDDYDESGWTNDISAIKNGTHAGDYRVVITNTLKTDVVDVPVMKKWDDDNNHEGIRPDSVKVRVMNGDGRAVDREGNPVADITLSDSNNWKDAFRALPATDDNGNPISYTVAEVDNNDQAKKNGDSINFGTGDEDYTVSITGDQKNGYSITNSYQPNSITVTAVKRWKDDEGFSEDTRRDVVLHLIGRTDSEKNAAIAYDGGSQTIAVDKNASEDAEAGTAVWTGLPESLNGRRLTWEIYEDCVPGYVMSGGDAPKEVIDDSGKLTGFSFDITNTYAGAVSKVKASKVWDDDNNRDGKRTDVYFRLYRVIGDGSEEPVGDPKPATAGRTSGYAPVGSVEWNNLPELLTEDGTGSSGIRERAVAYTVREGIYENGEWSEAAPDAYSSSTVQTAPGVFEIRNIHVPESLNINAVKVWNDNNDEDGIRPDHVTLKLMDGDSVVRKYALTAEDAAEGDSEEKWSHDFMGVPKYSNGREIEYQLEEVNASGYESVITGSAAEGFTVTNTHNSGSVISLEATKKWEGDEKDTGRRTDIKLRLVKVYDDTGARKVVEDSIRTVATGSNHDQEMTAVWNDLPTREKGKSLSYAVEEKAIEGYTTTYSDVTKKSGTDNVFEVTVTNTLGEIPDRGDVIYVDPRNPAGKNAMIVKSTRYRTPEEARAAAEARSGAPANPSHKGVSFIGWDLNWDDNDNFVLVALYSELPDKVTPVVSYVDGQSKKPLLVSRLTNDPSSVKAPKDPKHKNLQFVGWNKTVDAGGNTIFVAKYAPDCANGAGSGGTKGMYTTGKGKTVRTGDSGEAVLWFLVMIVSTALLAVYAVMRSRYGRRRY